MGETNQVAQVAVQSNKNNRLCPRVFIAIVVALAVIGAVLFPGQRMGGSRVHTFATFG